MHLDSLRLVDYRNIAEARLQFSPGLNLITGDNGQGKTNLLEAIGVLASGRSFRRAGPEALRRTGTQAFFLAGRGQFQGVIHHLEFLGHRERQAARLDGKAMSALSALGRVLTAVVHAPEGFIQLLAGGPGERRRYLDWLAFHRERSHAPRMLDYQKAVSSRNRLLKQERCDPRQLDAWEDRLAVIGAAIGRERRATLEGLGRLLPERLDALGLSGRQFHLALESHPAASVPEEAALRQLLLRSREADRRSGATSIGPHRDELRFLVGDRSLRQYASQGQQKRFLLALKLTEGALVREAVGEAPLFLLDDPASELDRLGVMLFMREAARAGHQLFVTSCRPDEIERPRLPWRRFEARAGSFRLLEESTT